MIAVKLLILQFLIEKRKQWMRRRIEKEFDKLYAKAEFILSKYQPCAISKVKGTIRCIDCMDGKKWMTTPNLLCCGGCKFHTIKGCIAEKPLTCKLWLCGSAAVAFPECFKQLQSLSKKAIKLGLYCARGDKKEILQNAYFDQWCDA